MTSGEKKYNNSIRYAGLAMQWMVMLLLAFWAGYKLDQWTGWKFPLFLIVLPLLALGYSLWQVVKEFNKPRKK
jgi:F0F1-type ATP synthase assembly protein I